MKRAGWLLWLLLIHLAAALLLFQNRDLLLASAGQEASETRPPPHYRTLRRAHSSIDPFVENGAVIFIGDSITEGLNTTALVANSVNYGISNDTTRGVLARLDDYASLDRAALVVLAIGVNDLVVRDVDVTVVDYREIVARIASRAPLLLAPVLPVDEAFGWPGLNARIDLLNRRIAELAGDFPGAELVGDTAAFKDGDGNLRDELHSDGVHLSENGYRQWIDGLRAAIYRNQVTN